MFIFSFSDIILQRTIKGTWYNCIMFYLVILHYELNFYYSIMNQLM
jgi:hypothetical protein